MKQLKSKTKLIARFLFVSILGLSVLAGCKSYDQDIEGLTNDINALKSQLNDLKTDLNGLAYIKSITLDEATGKLTITPSSGNSIVYDASEFVKYEIKLEGNKLYVNNAEKGSVEFPELTFDPETGEVKYGDTVVADLSAWLESNLPDIEEPGTTEPAEVEIELEVSEDGYIVVNGKKTTVKVKHTYTVEGGYLYVDGVKTDVQINDPMSIVFEKDDDGNVISVTITSGDDSIVIKENKQRVVLTSLVFEAELGQMREDVSGFNDPFVFVAPILSTTDSDECADKGVAPIVKLRYHVNPSSITEDDIDLNNISFYVKKNKTYLAPQSNLISVPSAYLDGEGFLVVEVQIDDFEEMFEVELDFDEWTMIYNKVALQVPYSQDVLNQFNLEDAYVTSDYINIQADAPKNLELVDPADEEPLPTDAIDCDDDYVWEDWKVIEIAQDAVDFDISDNAAAAWDGGGLLSEADMEKYGLYLEFTEVCENAKLTVSKDGKVTANGITADDFCDGVQTLVKVTVKSELGGDCDFAEPGYLALVVDVKSAVTNLTADKHLIREYWYNKEGVQVTGVFEEVKHNVQVPTVLENDPTNCNIANDIGQVFVQNGANTDGLEPKALKGVAIGYEFFFKPEQPVHTLASGAEYKFTVDAGGKKLLWNEGETDEEMIAEIKAFNATTGEVLELNRSSDVAKLLLNYGPEFLRATLGLKAPLCEDTEEMYDVTIEGNDSFDVVFVRPISASGKSAKPFEDGKSIGEVGTYIAISELVDLQDWREYKFSEYPNLYGYYDVSAFNIDTSLITTNLNQGSEDPADFVPLSDFPGLVIYEDASVPGVTPADPHGYLIYENNGDVIGQDFKLLVPVTIVYHWGEIVSTEILVTVKKTVGPSGVIKK